MQTDQQARHTDRSTNVPVVEILHLLIDTRRKGHLLLLHLLSSAYTKCTDFFCVLLVQICIWPSCCHCHSLSLTPVNPDWFYLSGAGSPGWCRTKPKRAIKWLCVCVFNVFFSFYFFLSVNTIPCLPVWLSGLTTGRRCTVAKVCFPARAEGRGCSLPRG